MNEPEYFLYGAHLVKFVPVRGGGRAILELNSKTGLFELNVNRLRQIRTARDDVYSLSEADFIEQVEADRARNLSGEGPVFALYAMMNGIEDVAKDEHRELTASERALLRQLRQKSYALFQAEHPDPTGD